jgi:hypothetical protein
MMLDYCVAAPAYAATTTEISSHQALRLAQLSFLLAGGPGYSAWKAQVSETIDVAR